MLIFSVDCRIVKLRKETLNPKTCFCNSSDEYHSCCGRFIEHLAIPITAEALMRSRYTAYVLKREEYLLETWHASTRPSILNLAQQTQQWLDLTVKRHDQSDTTHAVVEFVARYKMNGLAHRLHEISRFIHENGRWYYVDGDILSN